MASTFLTTVHGLRNFGTMWANSAGLYLASFLNIWVIYGVTIIFGIVFILFLKNYVDKLEDKPAEV